MSGAQACLASVRSEQGWAARGQAGLAGTSRSLCPVCWGGVSPHPRCRHLAPGPSARWRLLPGPDPHGRRCSWHRAPPVAWAVLSGTRVNSAPGAASPVTWLLRGAAQPGRPLGLPWAQPEEQVVSPGRRLPAQPGPAPSFPSSSGGPHPRPLQPKPSLTEHPGRARLGSCAAGPRCVGGSLPRASPLGASPLGAG